jgi:dihydrofolate synthase/folylpolyglutamate synthase
VSDPHSAYAHALSRLLGLQRFGVRPGLETTRAALAAVGDPQRGLSVVHVTGSNGKGSTAAFIERMLREAGYATGLFTSPHLSRFTERIRISGEEIGEAELAALTDRVLALPLELTLFEAVTVMAFLVFAERANIVVLEAGLGGRLDSTNVVESPLCTVVTGVALEHTDVLGDTLVAIAREKAGIWKPGVPAVLACRDDAARAVLLDEAARLGAPAYLLGRDFSLTQGTSGLAYQGPGGALTVDALGLAGVHQQDNAALALAATALACERLDAPIADGARRRGLAEVRWPGRLEAVTDDVLVDAAHNPDGARTLAAALPSLANGRPITLVLGVASDKDAAAMLAALRPLVTRVVATRPPSPRALPPEHLRALGPTVAASVGAAVDVEVIDAPSDAIAAARRPGVLTVVAGSIFLVAEARRILLGERTDPLFVQDPAASRKL